MAKANKGGTRCAVAGCSNNYYKTKNVVEGGQYIGYLKFPKEPRLRSLWVAACQRIDPFDPEGRFVCSVHFTQEDIVRDLRAEMGIGKPRIALKPGSVPSLKLPGAPEEDSPGTPPLPRTKRQVAKTRIEVVETLLVEEQCPESIECTPSIDYEALYLESQEENNRLRAKIDEMEARHEKTMSDLDKKVEDLRATVSTFVTTTEPGKGSSHPRAKLKRPRIYCGTRRSSRKNQ